MNNDEIMNNDEYIYTLNIRVDLKLQEVVDFNWFQHPAEVLPFLETFPTPLSNRILKTVSRILPTQIGI